MIRKTALALLLAALLPAAAGATESFTAWDPHFGFSGGPDQFVAGGHLQWGDVAPQLDFVPSLDLGLGDHVTLLTVNGDFHYRLDLGTQWQPYVGGGVGLHFVSVDQGGSDTQAGGHFIFGADVATKHHSRFFAEGKFGFGDSPDFKALAGWSFQPH